MTTGRQHAYDPDALADGTVVEVIHSDGIRYAVYKDRDGFHWQSVHVGNGHPQPWGDWRIVRVLDTTEVWEPLPKGPTDEHVGRMVKVVFRDTEMVAMLGKVEGDELVFSAADVYMGFAHQHAWFVLVKPEPADPDAELVKCAVAHLGMLDVGASSDEVARAIIAAVREAGEQT